VSEEDSVYCENLEEGSETSPPIYADSVQFHRVIFLV
jgi:hypothetical protein